MTEPRPEVIDSVKDPLLQLARSLATRTGRLAEGRALVDGARLIAQILEAGTTVEAVLVPDGRRDDGLVARADAAGVPLHAVRPGVLRHVLTSPTPLDGLAIVALRPEAGATGPGGRLTVVCDRVADPGNLGAIVRTARGLGCVGVVVTGDADVSGRRVIEASRGAVLRTSVHRYADGSAAVAGLRAAGWLVVATDGTGEVTLDDVEPGDRRVAVVVGNETDGLARHVRRAADVAVRIDLESDVESLNVAVAAGIALHAMRPRRQPTGDGPVRLADP